LRFLRCAYQAKVINTLDAASKSVVLMMTDIGFRYLRPIRQPKSQLRQDLTFGLSFFLRLGKFYKVAQEKSSNGWLRADDTILKDSMPKEHYGLVARVVSSELLFRVALDSSIRDFSIF
jgi:hypothetical protein